MKTLVSIVKDDITKVEIGSHFNTKKNEISGGIELDIENQSQFIGIINKLLDEGVKKIILDMSNINYIDSSGLWALFEGHKKTAQKEGKLVLFSPSKDVSRVLEITKMSAKMFVKDSEEKAIDLFA